MPLVLSGSVDISGSMTATTILVSSPGAGGMVSSSAQITELAPLMAYTASLKGAAIVSSSQQIQNYFTFARTGSVNTFFGNQGISGSLNVTSATGTNVTPQLTVNNTTTNGYGIVRLVGAGRGGIIDFYNTSSAQASITANDGALQIYTNGDSSGTAKVTVSSAGSMGVGTTTPGYKLDVNGDFKSGTSYLTGNTTFFSTAVNGAQNYGGSTIRIVGGTGTSAAGIQFGPADTNTTGARGRIGFLASANNGNPKEFAIIKGVLDSTGANTCNGSLTFHTLNGDNATEAAVRMTIDGSGNIGAASGTNIYNASDARLKQNISSISGSLDSVLALNPVKFNWVDDFVPSENGKDMLGFVAQEVQTIVPEAVESFGANSIFVGETEIDNPLRVNEKFLIPVLTKAIQEQQAIIDSLIARIEALENN
jgi:hypothetical protein